MNASSDFQRADGQNYAPKGKPQPVVDPGSFHIAAIALDHGHIYGQCQGLVEAGAEIKWVYDPDPDKVAKFRESFPDAQPAASIEEVLADPEIRLVAGAAITSERAALGLRVLEAGKDYFTDKAPFTTLDQLAQARAAVERTGQKFMVYFSERLHVECAVYAGQLIEQGAIGRVVHIEILAPHRLGPTEKRPGWFFEREKYGGILTDIGSHQFEQFLAFTGAADAEIPLARVANCAHPDFPELQDLGEAVLVADNGASLYLRVDWFTPDALRVWGDGRVFIIGTEGTMELRKYIDLNTEHLGEQLYLVNRDGEQHFDLAGKVGFPFFGALILDCINRTENAMTQAHAFKAAELSMRAQNLAETGREQG